MLPRWDRAALAASPRFAAIHPLLARLPGDEPPSLEALSALARERAVASGGGAPIRFVPDVPHDDAYETRIHATGEVPSRAESWHDLFNAFAWLVYPRTKAAINCLHVVHAHDGAAGARGVARDVLTLFDEDGLLMLCANEVLPPLLRCFRWSELFVEHRAEVQRDARFYAFGHALHEKALAPFRGLTANTLVVPVERELLDAPAAEQLAAADARAAVAIASAEILASTRALAPLPVLGIPGWTAENEDPAYYRDVTQFRPGRLRRGRA